MGLKSKYLFIWTSFFSLLFTLFFTSLLKLENLTAATATAKTCSSYFLQNNILNLFTPHEKESLEKVAQTLADFMGKTDSEHLLAKEEVNASIKKIMLQKLHEQEQHSAFRNWLRERIQFYQNLKKEHTNGILSEQQRRLQNLEKQKKETAAALQDISRIVKKYNAPNLSQALISAHNTLAGAYPEKLQDILFILSQFEQLELIDDVFQILVRYDHLPAVDYFINHKINVAYKDEKDNTALIFSALRNPNPEIIKRLAQANNGAELNFQNQEGTSPLHFAALNSNVEVLKVLLELGADPTLKNSSGRFPLHIAAENRNMDADTIRLLLKSKPEKQINSKDRSGITPLSSAVVVANVPVVKALLEAGADPGIERNSGFTALQMAVNVTHPSLEILQLLLNSKNSLELLSTKSRSGHIALHIAATSASAEAVQMLIDADQGAQLNARDTTNDTPLHFAVKSSIEVIKVLLNAGADPTLVNQSKRTPHMFLMTLPLQIGETQLERYEKTSLLYHAMQEWNRK